MTSAADDSVVRSRLALQQVAVHVLARRRHAVTGRFGLRPSPGGLATPLFGDGEVVRVTGATLVVERGGDVRAEPLTTLGRAADLVGVDLAAPFAVGSDTPAVADPDAPLAVDGDHVHDLGAWWSLGAALLDELAAGVPAVRATTVAQLWPEHFDLATAVAVGARGAQANLGASPGDGGTPGPYLYVGPFGEERPGDPGYWNAPFGAVLRRAEIDGLDPEARRAAARDFLRRGLDLLAGG